MGWAVSTGVPIGPLDGPTPEDHAAELLVARETGGFHVNRLCEMGESYDVILPDGRTIDVKRSTEFP
jgi:hypothetical protein